MTNDRKRRFRVPAAVGAALALAGGTIAMVAFPGTVSAQTVPTASAEAVCTPDGGAIRVSIVDDVSDEYDIIIGEEVVDSDVTDTDGGFYEYGPYADGEWTVIVDWIDGEETILDTVVTVDCAAAPPTTAAPTTIAVADATATAPAFTG
jgi:hypothetical protein